MGINKQCVNPSGFCAVIPPVYIRQNKYSLSVQNPDCSTVYTWHIQNPDGSWQPFTYSTIREFYLQVNGNYNILVRQDNLENFAGSPNYGIKTVAYSVFLYWRCYGFNNMLKANTSPSYSDDFEGEIHYTKFNETLVQF